MIWLVHNAGLEGGRKRQGVQQKRTSIIILTSFLLFFVYRGYQNLKRFTKYMIELNVNLLVEDGIECLFVGAYHRNIRVRRVVRHLRTSRARFCLPKF